MRREDGRNGEACTRTIERGREMDPSIQRCGKHSLFIGRQSQSPTENALVSRRRSEDASAPRAGTRASVFKGASFCGRAEH
ncbi:MAG: hypothetical protein DRN07_05815, partial [Thermoplasmata archaeon]